MRRTRRQCNRQQSRASRKMRRSSRLAHEAPVMLARRTTTRALPRIFRLIWIPPTPPPPKKPTWIHATKKEKYLPNFPTPKNPGIENFKPPKLNSFDQGPSLEIRSTTPPRPRPPAWLQDLWASETEKPSLIPSQYQELLSRRKPGDFLCFAAQDSFAY